MKKSRQDTGEAINRRYQFGLSSGALSCHRRLLHGTGTLPWCYVDGDYGAIIFRTKEEHDRIYDEGFLPVYEVEKDGKRRSGETTSGCGPPTSSSRSQDADDGHDGEGGQVVGPSCH